MVVLKEHIATLTSAVKNTQKSPVFISGTWTVPKDTLHLFYLDKDGSSRNLQFPASDQEVQALGRACEPASFGRNQEDVLDENYRKAGKMDRSQFAITLGTSSGISLEQTAKELLAAIPNDPSDNIDVELYKLNVYGPGSFFKTHKDTPRSEQMYGSLVVVLPTNFKGGELMLRHDGKEHTYEAGSHVTASDDNSVVVHWITFFSDVEHEVLPVTEGYRVTLTYNLFRSASSPVNSKALWDQEELTHSIKQALQDPNFLPEGCLLGFGLSHAYPASVGTNLNDVKPKGSDAVLINIFQAIGIKSEIRALYSRHWNNPRIEFGGGTEKWLTSKIVKLRDLYEEPMSHAFESSPGVFRGDAMEVSSYEADEIDEELEKEMFDIGKEGAENEPPILIWVTRPSHTTRVELHHLVYGNEASLAASYADLNLVVTIPPVSARG